MSVTITHAGGVITPVAVSEYSVEQEGGNIVHPILGSSDVDVVLRPASMRKGTLTLTFSTAADAAAARVQHATGGVFTLASPTVNVVNMGYILDGRLGTVQGKAGEWTLAVDFHEVTL